MRDAIVDLIRGFRFEITFHISTGQTEHDEPVPQGDVFSMTERAPIGFCAEDA